MSERRQGSAWTFWLLWLAATVAGLILYAIPVGVVEIVLGLDRLSDSARAGELTSPLLVLAGVLCGAAIGGTLGLAQWFVLRRELEQMGGWVVGTLAGYASIGLLPLIVNIAQPGWLDWAITLVVSGKMHWLARVEPTWPAAASWFAGGLTLILFGLVLGIAQWLVLRERLLHAGWWIAISAGGWAATVALSGPAVNWGEFVLVSWLAPSAITGTGMVWLLAHPIAGGSGARLALPTSFT